LRIAHAIGAAPEAADAAVPVVGDLEADKAIQAIHAFGAVGEADIAGGNIRAFAQDEVGRHARLAIAVQH
jgi:hypothetical protein